VQVSAFGVGSLNTRNKRSNGMSNRTAEAMGWIWWVSHIIAMIVAIVHIQSLELHSRDNFHRCYVLHHLRHESARHGSVLLVLWNFCVWLRSSTSTTTYTTPVRLVSKCRQCSIWPPQLSCPWYAQYAWCFSTSSSQYCASQCCRLSPARF
jgi:hypothetical protein